MPETETWTIGRLLNWTTDYLSQKGCESPRLDTELLLAEACGCERIDLYTAFDEVAGEKVRTAFRELVRRRAEGEPVGYLLGRREFYAMKFFVTPDVLIPRPETEFVVVTLLDLAKRRGDPTNGRLQVADIGTGSGILAVCAARHLPSCEVTATDVSSSALKVARRNAEEHKVSDRIKWFESDLFEVVPDERRFDFIVSNPPYVSRQELGELATEVKDHEPRIALVAGESGTEVIERLIGQAAERLVPGGWLIVEISPMVEARVLELIAAIGELEISPVVKDLAGHARVVAAQRKREG